MPHIPFLRWGCVATLLIAATASAQWEILPSPSTADLRGIHNVGQGIAWASGTHGTVLRTTNDGKDWQRCATPPDADKLDFRGIQAFDAKTAIVMSSGKGPLSRLYKTTDGCQTWTLLFTNPDPEGFWDAVQFPTAKMGWLLGDPVPSTHPGRKPQFVIYVTEDGGSSFQRHGYATLEADPTSSGAFAASNSSLLLSASEDIHGWCWFAAGGAAGARIFRGGYYSDVVEQDGSAPIAEVRWEPAAVSMASSASGGVFSIGVRGAETNATRNWIFRAKLAAVGGDYLKPDEPTGTAAYSIDGGRHWVAAKTPPRGFRSAVAYEPTTKTWITVGPNGTDISTDDGRNWRALKPSASDPPDADQHWNALSLPFAVGPHGRIGKLRPTALKPALPGAKP